MATNIITTRIKNRVDTLSNWQQTGVELLPGEIALVRVPTGQTYINPITEKAEPVMELLMKVGENGTDNKPKAFSDLPWLSAKAADVFAWAKNEKAEDVEISITPAGSETSTKKKLGDWLTAITTNAADIESLDAKLTGNANTAGTVAHAIKTAIDALDSTDAGNTSSTRKIVKAVTQTDGKVTVTYGELAVADLPILHASDIIYSDATGTEGQEGYKAAVTVEGKFAEIDAKFGALDSAITGGIHFIGVADILPTANSNVVKINGVDKTANVGDVIIVKNEEREFICTDTAGDNRWQELGDVSRIGDLETLVSGLETTPATSQFVTHITKDDSTGALVVHKAQPAATDIVRGSGASSSTVDADLTRIESSFVRIGTDNQLYAGKDGTEVIIFDCGGATTYISQ